MTHADAIKQLMVARQQVADQLPNLPDGPPVQAIMQAIVLMEEATTVLILPDSAATQEGQP